MFLLVFSFFFFVFNLLFWKNQLDLLSIDKIEGGWEVAFALLGLFLVSCKLFVFFFFNLHRKNQLDLLSNGKIDGGLEVAVALLGLFFLSCKLLFFFFLFRLFRARIVAGGSFILG